MRRCPYTVTFKSVHSFINCVRDALMYIPMALHDSFEVNSGTPHVPDRSAPIRCPEMEDKETTNTHSKLFYKSTDGEHLPHVVRMSYTGMQRMHRRQTLASRMPGWTYYGNHAFKPWPCAYMLYRTWYYVMYVIYSLFIHFIQNKL